MSFSTGPNGSIDSALATTQRLPFDLSRRYVRFRERHDNGFVEFDFSIGDPALSVELVMSQNDYEAFCHTHAVIYLSAAESEAIEAEQQKWQYGAPGISE
ncbi:phenol/toluene 2-monooxygenase (NADH) P0/A0 [Pararobbsia alpina]|uniref:phenol hydroxylase subunit n=1 Tax=Pararobbsia alpina TaxID=621374 RepID=UPI0039A4CEC9